MLPTLAADAAAAVAGPPYAGNLWRSTDMRRGAAGLGPCEALSAELVAAASMLWARKAPAVAEGLPYADSLLRSRDMRRGADGLEPWGPRGMSIRDAAGICTSVSEIAAAA